MNSEATRRDILDQYRNTSNKLKKRFLRKPNVTEACESFTSLGQYCEKEDMLPYAGLCWIAAARCEGSLGNIPGEISCLVRSARQFVSAEIKSNNLGCPSAFNENLQAALSCYTHASSRYSSNSPQTIALNLEVMQSLDALDLKDSKEIYLKNAVELASNSLDTKVHCLGLLALHYMEIDNYTSALESFTEISNLLEKSPPNGARSDLLLHCEICRVLLLLILRPAPQKLALNLAQLLEKYTWGDKNDRSLKGECAVAASCNLKLFGRVLACGMSENMFILMQSLVLTCQSLDTSSLPELEGQLWPLFTSEQKNLLRALVKVYCCY